MRLFGMKPWSNMTPSHACRFCTHVGQSIVTLAST
jgi:hypothetical protein